MSKRARRKASQRRTGQRAHAPPDARSPSHLAKRGFQGLVALVGLLIALTQLVDWLERRGEPELSAEFIAVTRDHLREVGRRPEPDVTEAELDRRGLSMRMRIRARADPQRRLPVRWTVYDAATGRPHPGDQWSQIFAALQARRDERDSTVPCFIPLPAIERFFVLLSVETVEGRVVADKRTKTLSTDARE